MHFRLTRDISGEDEEHMEEAGARQWLSSTSHLSMICVVVSCKSIYCPDLGEEAVAEERRGAVLGRFGC